MKIKLIHLMGLCAISLLVACGSNAAETPQANDADTTPLLEALPAESDGDGQANSEDQQTTPPQQGKDNEQPGERISGDASMCPAEIETWRVMLTRSGGFMGSLGHSIQVGNDGQGAIVDSDANTEVPITVSEEQLAQIESQLILACPFSVDRPAPDMVCADCFEYRLKVVLGEVEFVASANDVTLGQSAIAPLVQAIQQLESVGGE